MTDPIRNPANTVISVSMSRATLAEIDQRAQALGMSRSQYLCQLARVDVAKGGDLTLRESTITAAEQATNDTAAANAVKVSYLKTNKPAAK